MTAGSAGVAGCQQCTGLGGTRARAYRVLSVVTWGTGTYHLPVQVLYELT